MIKIADLNKDDFVQVEENEDLFKFLYHFDFETLSDIEFLIAKYSEFYIKHGLKLKAELANLIDLIKINLPKVKNDLENDIDSILYTKGDSENDECQFILYHIICELSVDNETKELVYIAIYNELEKVLE